jgi:coiled-coil and C2 domain-containing protein 1
MINDDDLTQDLAHSDRDTIFRRLQEDLLRQIQLCARNQQIYAEMDEPNSQKHANEYKILEQRCSHDLEKLRQCFQHGLKPPLFHYERKQMTIIQTNHDLGDNDLEVTILRGINLPVPSGISSSSLETYVTIEFPYPTETPQIARTRHAGGSTNAEYPESIHKFYIKRNDAKFKRLMNRKELKLAVFYKPGFLRSDRPLGTASIKLAALEQSCTIHESVDLYEVEHKKKIEGKLEVKLRIKEALGQTKASDILPQRWLVIDRFEEQVNFQLMFFFQIFFISYVLVE